MLYLLDTNVLIDANRDYYPIGRVPEFWSWLVDCAAKQKAKVPLEIYGEVCSGKEDRLVRWLKDRKDTMVLDENVDIGLIDQVMARYAPDLNDEDIRKLGRDPFLIAYALCNPTQRFVVTTEVSKPRKKRANRHIPDVCEDLHLRCYNTFDLIKQLNFRTNWQNHS